MCNGGGGAEWAGVGQVGVILVVIPIYFTPFTALIEFKFLFFKICQKASHKK